MFDIFDIIVANDALAILFFLFWVWFFLIVIGTLLYYLRNQCFGEVKDFFEFLLWKRMIYSFFAGFAISFLAIICMVFIREMK